VTDEALRDLFGPLTASVEVAGGCEEQRTGGPLADAVLGFFPIVSGATRIEAAPASLRVFVSGRRRGSTPHLTATLVHGGVATPAVEVFLSALPAVKASVVERARGKPLTTPAEVAAWYERELAALRKRIEKRLARIDAALLAGEVGFYAHDAWPEA